MTKSFSWVNPKLEVRRTSKYGLGTFALKGVRKGELLCVAGGYVMLIHDEESLPDGLGDNGIQVTDDLSICVSKRSELGGINFFNHSCEPNAGIKGQIFLVAMRKIATGEEVTFDYAMTLCQSKGARPYRLTCLCGRAGCRGVVTDRDWQDRTLQERYDGHFQYFIQEKIDKRRMKDAQRSLVCGPNHGRSGS